ncbi:alpha/beta hydrolase [Nonlabens agnitus]|uniref:Serine aminopeptidase S33 domain-containing protein n=1 Tax=Nonlabens agnitus TaxID=870484 RepID=A0A2S9WVG3_9FLAO|nr:alpha/beta fold hydrolase [Nonlabens agnitus]PRP67462.1 hypothetical protein BST86_10340 [Nonlabens agnitus]
MKRTFTIIFLTLSIIANSQNIYDYEKEIGNRENYIFSEIDFQNEDENIKLSGTLITPKTKFDTIILIVAGSGRDSRHTHFVLAEELLKHGIAVYRFDERGVGKSKGEYSELVRDLSNDLGFALKKIQQTYLDKKIGIIGHSIGGIATLNAINDDIDFIVLIETPIAKNGAFLVNQFKMNYENSLPEVMRKGKTKIEITSFLEGYIDIISKSEPNATKKEVKKYIKEKEFKKDIFYYWMTLF